MPYLKNGRIIPALAGNTVPTRRDTLDDRDHPRSRGEYGVMAVRLDRAGGSSPLSRGIPRRCQSSHTSKRIIPALAGNTLPDGVVQVSAWDHPRSRGEYQTASMSQLAVEGSSPLSRGILLLGEYLGAFGRIIPALAGNTVSGIPGAIMRADHPRSRGEYLLPL